MIKSIQITLKHLLRSVYKQVCLWRLAQYKTPSSRGSLKGARKTAQLGSVQLSTATGKNYFVEAADWADEVYTQAVISRNRYRLAFLVAMGLAILLTITLDVLLPLEHLVPLLVNHYPDGRVSIQPMTQAHAPPDQSQVESDIVRYVNNRERYDASAYDEQYSLVNLLSSDAVANAYIREQSPQNKAAPIVRLGKQGIRTVHIDSVVFLDTQASSHNRSHLLPHHNLAQINFTVSEYVTPSGVKKSTAFTALISWEYHGTPRDPGQRWRNWDGFVVTRYTVAQRNVTTRERNT